MGIIGRGRRRDAAPVPNAECGVRSAECGVRNVECGIVVTPNSALRTPHWEHLFLHGESENGPVFSGTYGLHLFSTCISRRRLRNALIMLIQEMWFGGWRLETGGWRLEPTAHSLQPTAHSLQPTACSSQPTAPCIDPASRV